ncbi:MAG TPA: class I adenylate-forming enzyme family protein [Burkholderiales bacterium]|nr:class I adenylate-forming enzyme family protein [Burkholderiales bacterium]HEX2650723.1 class I adenylate-forming enzyme family protein [Burkholderiales bacterium]
MARDAAPLHPDAAPSTLGALLRRAAARHGDAPALSDGRRRLTYAQYDAEVDRLARALLRAGVRPREHVALWMRNCVEWVLTEMAVFRLGAVLVPLSPRGTSEEAAYILAQSDSRTLVLDEAMQIPPAAREGLQRVIRLGAARKGEMSFEALPAGPHADLEETAGVDDTAIIIYTSGSTAAPKGVMLGHGQITRNLYEVRVIPEELTSADRVLYVLPMCHIMGALNSVVGMMHVGGCLALREGFSPQATLEAIEAERPTWFYGVTAMFVDLMRSGLLGRHDTSSLRRFTLFPGPFKREFLAELLSAFRAEGLNTRYGLTETTNGLTSAATWRDGLDKVVESIGRPLGSMEFQIVDPATRHEVAAGEDGELRVRGFAVMQGYYRNEAETRKVIDPEGWFYTGDLMCRDEAGYFYFKGRIKDALKTLGNNVSCLEVEAVLQSHPAVASAALVGIPDERASEVGAAFVQLRAGMRASGAELAEHCRRSLAGYKVPRHFRFVETFPLSTSGKIHKPALRERILSETVS